jgi:hypothetical protein
MKRRGKLDGKVRRLGPAKDLVRVLGDEPVPLGHGRPNVGHEPAVIDKLPGVKHARQAVPCRQLGDPLPLEPVSRAPVDDDGVGTTGRHRREGVVELGQARHPAAGPSSHVRR